MSRIFSGVQPTGCLTLGNYLGAIRNWVDLQNTHDSLFCIVDLHALTTQESPHELQQNTRKVAAAYLASGIDPQRSTVFVQSHVPQHTELSWILSCATPLGWLNRMTQFKDKAGKHREKACLGLYAYPVLMAADILLYKATHVPVGDDQKQHLELARDIANSFNYHYQSDFFPLPEPQILGTATRVMSLRDGRAKMSKSDLSDYSRITFDDDNDAIAAKIRKAKTDPDPLPSTRAGLAERPEAQNLVNIYAALSGEDLDVICQRYAGSTFAPFKQDLANLIIATLGPLRDEMNYLLQDPAQLDNILRKGAEKARTIAEDTLKQVRDIIGLLT